MMEKQALLGKEKEIIDYCNEKNILVAGNAVRLLGEQNDFRKLVDEFSSENVFVLTEHVVRERLLKKDSKIGESVQVVVKNASFRPIASQIEHDSRVLVDLDVTNQSRSGGKVADFLEMFRDKFEFLSGLLKKRASLEVKPISRLSRTTNNHDITVCGMVSRKWVSKNGHPVMELEDLESTCIALFQKTDHNMFELSKKVMLDDVIAVKGKKISNDMIIVSEVHWPEIPIGQIKSGKRDLNLVAISDIHVGSRLFLEKEFMDFVSWINGNVQNEKEKEEVEKVKYLLICGDNVDGIGVYPDQFDDLAIKDIYEQYDAFGELLKQIPEYIEVFIIPGQHDAVRRADPQPGVKKEFVKSVAGYKNIHFIGSPSWIEIEGLKLMLYHGASLHDIYASIPGLDHAKPQDAMAILLKRRDIMAPYGQSQPYVPERRDFMVVREEPDFYFGGDMHHNGYTQYRACSVINAGTWQDRTAFQVQQGYIPTPGIAVQVSLESRKISEKRFM